MTFSLSRFVRRATSSKAAAVSAQPVRGCPVELQAQQLRQVAGGAPKGGWIATDTSTPDAPKGGWA